MAGSAVKRALEGGVGRRGRDGGAVPEVEREGLGEGVVAQAPRGQVAVAQHQLGGAGHLQARGEVAGVALGERRGGVHPGAAAGPEPGAAQHLVAPVDLGADLAGDPGLGERGQVDGHVGLVDHLVAAERGELVEGVQPPSRARRLDRAHRQRVHGEGGRHVVMVRQRVGHGGHAARRDGNDHADAQGPPVAETAVRLLVGEEGGEAGQRGRRALPHSATETG